ncbi:MAG: alanine racemase [Deltaproteobacteria bacterium]|nr:alanine racemase [Deltaproteobacteria bacterium]
MTDTTKNEPRLLRTTRAVIDLEAIGGNIAAIRDKIGPSRELMAVVKADGYGHGAVQVSLAALKNGATWLGVALPEEGAELRRAGIGAPILVLGPIQPQEAAKPIAHHLDQTVCSMELAEALSQAAGRAGKRARVHLKVETGMGRVGVSPEEAAGALKKISEMENVEVVGLFSHLSSADEADKEFTHRQLTAFEDCLRRVEAAGLRIPLTHLANSAGVLDFPQAYYDLVRPGIMIYGLYPSAEVSRSVTITPAMTLTTKVSHLKEVGPGAAIGYGHTYFTDRPTKVATLPVGYADGYSRLLSNRGQVLIRDQRAPIIGRVCMDMLMVDVTGLEEVQVGDEAILYGKDLSVDEVAGLIGTICNEVVCTVSKRVPRVYSPAHEN